MTSPNEKAAVLKPVRQTTRYAVFDDVLAPDEFQRLWDYIQLDEYTAAHHARWEKAWRLTDGQPLVGVMVQHQTEPSAAGADYW